MKLLLDTHVLLWWLDGGEMLPENAINAIRETPYVYVSAATTWEISIKKSAGALESPDDLREQMHRHRFHPLPITVEHGMVAGQLPRHHKDPFNRMLVAQAQCEELTLITRDSEIKRYDVGLLLV